MWMSGGHVPEACSFATPANQSIAILDQERTDVRIRASPVGDAHRSAPVGANTAACGGGGRHPPRSANSGGTRGAECRIGTWNVRGGLKDKTNELIDVMNDRRLDALFVTETKRKGSDTDDLPGGMMALWSGVDRDDHASAGVGVVLSSRLATGVRDYCLVGPRLLWVRIKLGITRVFLVAAYAPVSSACAQELEKFWESVRDVLDLVEGNERVIMCGDLNGWVGTKRYSYEAVLGPYGDKRVNEAGNAHIMEDPGGSQDPVSQSILIPESPGSPEFLDPRSPGPPAPWNEPQVSETLSQGNDDSNQSTATVHYNADAWRLDRLEENSNSAQPPTHDDSDFSSAIQSMNEESNSLLSLPEPVCNAECDEPPAKIRKICSPKPDDTDGETCPICLDTWGNSGEHRLVALKCGHLFGLNCVERWLKSLPAKERKCPTCKDRAQFKDLRHIYARRLVAADTSQITALQKQLEALQAEKCRAELALQKSEIAHRACLLQLDVLRSTLMKSQVSKDQPVRRSWRFALEKNLEICKDGGCRVMTYNCRTYEFYVSQKSTNNLFPGYGIRKVSCVDYKLGQFVHLHPKQIRDITYSQPRDLLLSVGLDSTARIVERGIPSITVTTGMPLWSCSWDYMRSNEFYVGGVGGVIHQYDVRNPSAYIQRLTAPGDMSPVVSLSSTEYGLLSCQLNSSWLWMGSLRQWEPRSLPLEGPFMSLCYDNESHRALVSCRATNNSERSRLAVCKLKASVPSGEVLFDMEQTFNGSARSSLLSRPTWVRVTGASWVAAHSESDSTLYLHGIDGSRTMSLPAAEPALDVCCAQLNGDTVLAALSDSRLRLYKAVSTNS